MSHQMRAESQGLPEIVMTESDAERLDGLPALSSGMGSSAGVQLLLQELLRARIVEAEEIPASVVTMHSVVEFRDDVNGEVRVVRLIYPGEQPENEGAISVLAPVGAALIGLSEGQSISYIATDQRPRSLTVLKVLSQPEAVLRTNGAGR